MLREVKVVFEDGKHASAILSAAQSLLRWLERHGTAVRSFDINLQSLYRCEGAQLAILVPMLDSWLALCSSGLEELYMDSGVCPNPVGAWASSCPRLQELSIYAGLGKLRTPVTLSSMTALQRLVVGAGDLQLGAAVQLPASLTRLYILWHGTERMPKQVGRVTSSTALSLWMMAHTAGAVAV
jgi:hypothetical protein